MTPVRFAEANAIFGPPEGMTEHQVRRVPGYIGETLVGSCDGMKLVIVAHLPDERDKAAIAAGAPIFLTMVGGLAPHFLSTNFAEANNPA